MAAFEVSTFILAVLISVALIFFAVWNIISFDDLKTDYKNPVDLCNSLNPLVLPEYGLHLFICLFFLVGFFWTSLIWNMPLIAYHVHSSYLQFTRCHFSKYMNRPVMSRPGLYDPTIIMNGSEMSRCQKEGWVKLAYYLLSFFFYLYRMMSAILA